MRADGRRTLTFSLLSVFLAVSCAQAAFPQTPGGAATPPPVTPGGNTQATVPPKPAGASRPNPGYDSTSVPPAADNPAAPNVPTVSNSAAVPVPTLTGIMPAAPLIAPNQPLKLTGSNFQDKLSVTITDPMGNSSVLPTEDVLQVTPQSVVVVATLGLAGTWKVQATNPNGNPSSPLQFAVASAPAIAYSTPHVIAFAVAAVIVTLLLWLLFRMLLTEVDRALTAKQWSIAEALSEECEYQPKEITRKEDVIMVASTSRLIALLGLMGILSTVLGIGYAIMWNLFIYGTVPDLTEVRSFLFGSACLFAPYLANQVGSAFNTKSKAPEKEAEPSKGVTGVEATPPAGKIVSSNTRQTVAVTGTGFQPDLTITLTDPQYVERTVPAGAIHTTVKPTLFSADLLLNTPGSWKIVTTNPSGEKTEGFRFTVFGPPVIKSIDPASPAKGQSVEFDLVGVGFVSGIEVKLAPPTPPGGAAPAPFNAELVSVSCTRVKVKAALTAGTGWTATATNPGGYASNAQPFDVS